ncbi:hypothetical protein D3C85_1276660 [compost metagenome]
MIVVASAGTTNATQRHIFKPRKSCPRKLLTRPLPDLADCLALRTRLYIAGTKKHQPVHFRSELPHGGGRRHQLISKLFPIRPLPLIKALDKVSFKRLHPIQCPELPIRKYRSVSQECRVPPMLSGRKNSSGIRVRPTVTTHAVSL